MIQVKNNEVVKTSLPKNGFLSDGRAVSNYDCLPTEVLASEDWVEPKKVTPSLRSNEKLGFVKYEIKNNEWIETFGVIQDQEKEQDVIALEKSWVDSINIAGKQFLNANENTLFVFNFNGNKVSDWIYYAQLENKIIAEGQISENGRVEWQHTFTEEGFYRLEVYAQCPLIESSIGRPMCSIVFIKVTQP